MLASAEATLWTAEESLFRPWMISEADRAAIVRRIMEIIEAGKPMEAIAAAAVMIRMDRSNWEAAKVLLQLDGRIGLSEELDRLAAWLDAPEQPVERAIAS
jgi:hypothetical protein